METTIKWIKGTPTEKGLYLITTDDGIVGYEWYREEEKGVFHHTYHAQHTKIIAHCRMRDIEPYKEDE